MTTEFKVDATIAFVVPLIAIVGTFFTGCAAKTSYVQAPSTAKVQTHVTEATQSNRQLKDLSVEERELDRRKSNKDLIIERWRQLQKP